MVQFLSINFFSWISSIFVGFFKSSRFFVSLSIKIYIIQSDTTLYFIKLYQVIIPATCFGSICRAIFRLIGQQLECTIDNAFNLIQRINIDTQKILRLLRKLHCHILVRENPNHWLAPSSHNHPISSIVYDFKNLLYRVPHLKF